MKERIIENWLTNTNERGYQIPFCQILMLEGHKIIHVSKHGEMEQGKDIITLDQNSKPCAYQLKSGDINITRWRQIREEINELLDWPINHPNIDKNAPFQAYLVTNGEITDGVRRGIDDDNNRRSKQGKKTLKLILGKVLLSKFVDDHNTFFPEEPMPLIEFLELYFADGKDLLQKPKLALLLENILLEQTQNKSITQLALQRRISSAAIITQYVTTPFENKENHLGIFESWIIFCAYVLALIESKNLNSEYWRTTFDIIIQKISDQLTNLKNEFLSKKIFFEGEKFGDGGILYKARITMVIGWLCALELFRSRLNKDIEPDERIFEIAQKRYEKEFWYWGESATPYFLMVSLFCEMINKKEFSWKIILNILAELCGGNLLDNNAIGIPDPYVSVESIIGEKMGLPELYSNKSNIVGFSYHLSPLVYFAARRNKRTALNELWKKISKIGIFEYQPRFKWQYTTWISKQGKELTSSFKERQSWNELIKIAFKKERNLPNILYKIPEFLFFFLLVYPHRLNSESLRLLDEIIDPY